RQESRADGAQRALGGVGLAGRVGQIRLFRRQRRRRILGRLVVFDRLAVGTDARERKLLGALFGDHDVARRDGVVRAAGLERVVPGFARAPAAAGGVERLAVLEGGRQLGVELAGERDGLRHFLARIVVGVELRLRRRTHALAGLLVVAEVVGRGGVGHREIKAVAGAHANGAEGAAHRPRRIDVAVVVAEQIVEEPGSLAGERRRAVLRAAAVVGERDQQRLALRGALGGAAGQLFQVVLHALELRASLPDLADQRPAGRRRVAEDRKEAGAFAAHAARLRDQAVDRVLGAANLLRARRIGIAAVERRQLRLQALAGRAGGWRRLRQRRSRGGQDDGGERAARKQGCDHGRHFSL